MSPPRTAVSLLAAVLVGGLALLALLEWRGGGPAAGPGASRVAASGRPAPGLVPVADGEGELERIEVGPEAEAAEPPASVELKAPAPPQRNLDPKLVCVRFETMDGRLLEEALAEEPWGRELEAQVAAIATLEHPGTRAGDGRRWSMDGFGAGVCWSDGRSCGPTSSPVSGMLALGQEPPLYVSAVLRHVVLSTVWVPVRQPLVTLRVDLEDLRANLSSLTLHVVDEDTGRPLPGAQAQWMVLTPSSSMMNDRTYGADDEGRILIGPALPGFRNVTVHAAEHSAVVLQAELAPGQGSEREVRLRTRVVLRGTVVDSGGLPVAAKFFRRPREEASARDLSLWRLLAGQSDAGGRLELSLPRGRSLLQAGVEGEAGTTVRPVEVDTREGDGITLVLDDVVPVRLVWQSLSPPATRAEAVLRDAAGRGLWWQEFRPGTAHEVRLAPGRYSWILDGEVLGLQSGTFDVGATPLEVRLTAEGLATGPLVD